MSNEVYPRAPVRFVAFIANFPFSPKLQRQETKEVVYERLADTFPLLDIIGAVEIRVPIAIGTESSPPNLPAVPEKLRMMNRERTRSVTIGPRMIGIELTDHESYESLRGLLATVLGALVEVAEPSAINRLALQYIDEIRHPDVAGPRDWHDLLQEPLVGAVDLLDAEVEQTSAIAVYRLGDGHEVRIVHGAAPTGFAVDPDGPLRVKPADEGPFFRLDIASEWTAPSESVPPFTLEKILTVADQLHAPIREVFENAITPVLRDYFRTKEAGEHVGAGS